MTPGWDRGPLGSRLLGDVSDGQQQQQMRVQLLLTGSILIANIIGAGVVVALIGGVIPGDPVFVHRLVVVNAVVLPLYVVGALVLGALGGTVLARRDLRWALDGREATLSDLQSTLLVPRKLTVLQAALWGGALILFTAVYATVDPQNAARVAFPIAYGGIVVCANAYLLSEFALRPIAARALLAGSPPHRPVLGVRGRTLLAWGLGSGIPVAGLMTVAIFALRRHDVSADRLDVTILALGAVTLTFGLLLTFLGGNAIVAPLRGVRAGLRDVESGELETRVVVYDATELGELQAGFNRMAAGLSERERLRDLFGRQVGRDVAQAALDSPPELGGEEREIAAFFIDMVGSTTLAETHPPAEVVALLNAFFSVVVDEVERRGGIINKFQGDGALAVFGAPLPLDDPAGRALAAARRISERLRVEVPDCRTGTGIAAGVAVAGNVGDARRFEYTVIGDPVNQAARLAELAKDEPGGVLASGATVKAASPDEADRWSPHHTVTLRGRSTATTTAVPTTPPHAP